jgi:hypothetical protein
MTNNGKHDASPLLEFPISSFFFEDDSVRRFSRQARIGHASSKNRVNFSSARTTKRFLSRWASAIQIVRDY